MLCMCDSHTQNNGNVKCGIKFNAFALECQTWKENSDFLYYTHIMINFVSIFVT
jgi:hypothetical protein